MNNTHKLLLAFIEASGYEVEESLRCKGTEEGRDYEINDYKVTKKSSEVRWRCTKCGTHLGKSAPQCSCLCGTSENLVKADI